ncbi:hypothetical protein, partial [Paenibacillus xylanexedens]|uniref:hypothetical protein n=1 Tax=Paenibacillus xylanexedens TaxID=528191 RepID=UPI00119DF649
MNLGKKEKGVLEDVCRERGEMEWSEGGKGMWRGGCYRKYRLIIWIRGIRDEGQKSKKVCNGGVSEWI